MRTRPSAAAATGVGCQRMSVAPPVEVMITDFGRNSSQALFAVSALLWP